MKDNFLSKAYGGVREARNKLNGLGLPRQWKVITSTLFLLFTFAIGNVWGAASSVIPATPDYKDISTVATDGTYTFTCSSDNIKNAANATSSWIGWYSTQSSFKEYDKSGSALCMGTQTKIPNLKYDKVYFYVTNCTSFEIQAWGNGDNRHVNYSYQATDAASATEDSFTSADNKTCASSGEISLDASKSYTIIVWNDTGTEEIGVTYMVFNTNSGGDPVAVTGITIAPSPVAVKVGKTTTLSATVTPSNATDKAVTWAVTSGSSYASVTDAGVVTGLEEGTAVITATAHDGSGVTQTVTVNVEECPTSGTLFSMTVTDPDGTVYTDVTKDAPQLIGATYTGGKAYAASTSTSKRSPKITGTEFDFNVSSSSSVVVKIELDCPLAEGDIISFTSSADKEFKIQKVAGTSLYTTSSLRFAIPESSSLIGEEVVYVLCNNSACKFSQITITRPVYRTIILKYADGETADGSISAVEGAPATKPTDPTWEHHRFAGWYNGETPYDWTANVTGDLTLTAHWTQLYTVTYKAGDGTATGDAPTQVDKAEGETFTVAANTFEVAGKDFVKWNDGTNDYAPGATYTVGTDNVVLTAQWKAAADKYTVIFKDGTTELGTKLFDVTTNPSDADIDKTKALNTFAAWQKEGADIALDDAFWATVAKDAEITLTARWTALYAETADLAAEAAGAKTAINTFFAGKNYASTIGSKGEYDTNASGYLGYKFKDNGDKIQFNLKKGKIAEIAFMYIETSFTISVDGAEVEVVANKSTSSTPLVKYVYANGADKFVELLNNSATGKTSVINKIVIRDPYEVSYDADGGDPVAAQYGEPSVILPLPTKGTESFLGWYDGETKVGEAGDKYTPTANITLKAHWEAVSTDTRIKALTYTLGAAAPVDIYEADKNTFNIALPYARAYDAITVAATPNHASASIKVGAELTVSSIPGTATFTIVAQSGAEENYTVNFTKAPKDGVSIIKVATTGGTNKTVTGLYAEDGAVSIAGDKKFGSSGQYIGLMLEAGQTFNENDIINIHTTTAAAQGSIAIYSNSGKAATMVHDYAGMGVLGDNKFALPADVEELGTLYVCRTDANTWNGYVDFIEVTRAMNPVLTAITINGSDGVIDPLDDKHFTVTIPNDANLASLTVEPTIVRNAPHATTPEQVMTNSGAWVLTADGDNRYRIMDKDGDYTDYTITLIRDVLKHTVSFNTHGGSAIADVEVVHGQYLAAAPADPTKDENTFKFWSEDEDGAEVDVTTVQINTDKEFHAVWEAEPAGIKLFDGDGNLNTTNFVSPAKTTIEINEVEHVCLEQFSSNRTSLGGATPADMVKYDVTTDEAKIKMTFYNNNSGIKKAILYKYEEGGTPEKIEIEVPGQEIFTTEYYTFNSSKNRSFYVCMNDRSNIRVLQVKVIDNGANPVKQFGQVGYSLNLNKGRFYAKAAVEKNFEGFTFTPSSEYKVYNNSNLATTSANSFTIASPAVMSVTRSGGKYYVYQDPADKGTLYSGNAEIELNTTGTWYISSEKSGSAASFSTIEFLAPKCQQPTVADMENIGLCEGDAFTALTVSASVTDGGTLHYQWYKHPAAGDDEAVGTDAASYTPEADGQYYVVVTNQLADHSDNSKASNMVTVEHFASAVITTAPLNQRGEVDDVVTLSVVATGKNLSYKWFTCDDESGTNSVAIDPEETNASLDVTITAGMNQWYKVLVTSDCGNAEATARVSAFEPTAPANVTGSITWDWKSTTAGFPTENTSIDFTNTEEEELFADVDAAMPNNEYFRSDMLYGIGQRAWRKSNNDGECGFQGFQIRFNTEVAGRVRVYFRAPSSGQTSAVTIDGKPAGSRGNSWGWSEYVDVEANTNVIIAMTNGETGMTRVQKIEFEKRVDQRGAGWAAAGELGTVCLKSDAVVTGANLYELQGLDVNGYLAFDQILNGKLEAGKPYLFEATSNALINFYAPVNAGTADQAEVTNGMHGTFTNKTYTASDESIYYFSGRHIWAVKDFTVSITIPAYYCYVDMSELRNSGASEAPAPGRRRISMSIMGSQIATGIENTGFESEAPSKVLINGELFIIRGEKMYDAKGQLVK